MKVVMVGDIAESIVEAVRDALPFTDKCHLRYIVKEAIPSYGILIEATKDELANIKGNLVYKEVAVTPKEESEVKRWIRKKL